MFIVMSNTVSRVAVRKREEWLVSFLPCLLDMGEIWPGSLLREGGRDAEGRKGEIDRGRDAEGLRERGMLKEDGAKGGMLRD